MIAKIAEIQLLLDKNDIKYTTDFRYLNETKYIYPFYLISIINENNSYANLHFYNDFALASTGKNGEKNAAVWKVQDIKETVEIIKNHFKSNKFIDESSKLTYKNLPAQLIRFIKNGLWV